MFDRADTIGAAGGASRLPYYISGKTALYGNYGSVSGKTAAK